MDKKFLNIVIGLFLSLLAFAQQQTDSLHEILLNEVTIVGKSGLETKNENKPLSSIDDYMEQQGKLSLVKRGNYACEPTINNMATERISMTIDGMKIFCACTDKMDPITSYVEIVNLSKIQIGSGVSGSPYSANSIGGSIDMKLFKASFHENAFKANVYSGYETNGNYKTLGTGIAYSSPKAYSNSSFFFRKSDDYLAGGNDTINFSQFQKLNFMNNTGFRVAENHVIESTLIYDLATDVGYPALPMDVKSAKGFITSLSYTRENLTGIFSKWESKVYFNAINHVMDDTKRPNVVMHMDMPGKSKTFGFYSTLPASVEQHNVLLNVDAYYNQSLAEMTMYPSDPKQKTMFMYTWPDVRVFNGGVYAEDKYSINSNHSVQLSSRLSVQHDGVESTFGFNSLRIYYPGMDRYQNRFLGNLAAKYLYFTERLLVKIGGGFGIRPPSPTEAYGFYLYNSYDNYDYLGNPLLKNESSWEGNFAFSFKTLRSKWNLETSFFYFNNYIIGKPQKAYSSMTINASGVKVYQNLSHAKLLNVGLEWKQAFLSFFNWSNKVSYAYGRDNINNPLPLISPLSFYSSINFSRKAFFAEVNLQGAAKQNDFSADYGEKQTPAYLVVGSSVGYNASFKRQSFSIKIGIENIFDKKYSTFSDWNHIPRKGRNVFVNLGLNI